MQPKHKATLLLLCCSALPCFAGGLKGGPLISDTFIYGFMIYVAFAHLLGLVTFFVRKTWLRIVCGIIYLPVFIFAVGTYFVNPWIAAASLLFAILFLVFIIAWPRK